MKIVLASASPRRKELMKKVGLKFETMVADVDETVPEGVSPIDSAMLIAQKKALKVSALRPDDAVVGADTIVVIDGDILGKPGTEDDAIAMLTRLSGKEHTVITGVCIARGNEKITFAETTRVKFYALTKAEIEDYVKTGEPMDKAGAYGVQGLGCVLVERIDGDYFNVMGLPIASVVRAMKSSGLIGI